MKEQIVWREGEWLQPLTEVLQENGNNAFVVCGKHCVQLDIVSKIKELPVEYTWFHDFEVNPKMENVHLGVECFRYSGCRVILAIGGGSALDVAKCIKLYGAQKGRDCILIVIPTTAGTGSEATKFAVVYSHGEKQSVEDEAILPDYVIMEPDTLQWLPVYQRKVTMADALCHAIESYWSVNSTEESKEYSAMAIQMILSNLEGYLQNGQAANRNMLWAANCAGKAINITKTTAAHAMSYKLTSLYQIAHGHAVLLCLPGLWRYMNEHLDQCADTRGSNYVKNIFEEIAETMGCDSVEQGIEKLEKLVRELGLVKPTVADDEWDTLLDSVNVDRLKNSPVCLQRKDIEQIYKSSLA